MTGLGGGGYANQARGAAEGKAGGPMFTPGGPHRDKWDIVILVVVLAVMTAAILFLVLR